MTYRDRRIARAERLREWAAKREHRSAAAFRRADTIAHGIPMGQPILVGHHSERRHRRDVARIDAGMRAGLEHADKAREMASRAETIEAAAERAIYRDDADAIERLEAKIADLEAGRQRIKAVNQAVRKYGLDRLLAEDPPFVLTEAERRELLQLIRLCPYHHAEKRGFPPYVLQNLGGNISRERARLADLTAAKTPSGQAVIAPMADTATARAGLTVRETLTTPSRPGKQPRPVWEVSGNLAFWRPLLEQVGGNWYRGRVSFWADPSADIEAACLQAEQEQAPCPDTTA